MQGASADMTKLLDHMKTENAALKIALFESVQALSKLTTMTGAAFTGA